MLAEQIKKFAGLLRVGYFIYSWKALQNLRGGEEKIRILCK